MSGFSGFAEFAKADSFNSTTAAATLARRRQAESKKKPSVGDGDIRTNKFRPSPIYTGSDGRLTVLFRKIGQKRDPATKVRALEELSQCVFPPISKDTASSETDNFPRPEKIAALCHLVFLHETKLGYDNNFSVRAGSYKALTASKDHVPKAWIGLFVGESDDDAILCPAATTVGMAWIASRGDPAAEVAKNAAAFVTKITSNAIEVSKKVIKEATCKYSKAILSCKRASSLQDVVNPTSVQSTTSGVSNKSTASAGKSNKNKSENAPVLNESEKEEMEECYERVMLSVLSGVGWLVQCYPEISETEQSYVDMACFPDSSSIIRILQSSRGSFRREGYTLIGKLCQFAPSLIMSESSAHLEMAPMIPNLLSSEKESPSFSPLLEMVLTYFAAFRNANFNVQWEKLDSIAFTKSLSKSLRRACYGAPASTWSPMILPLVASLPRQENNENVNSPAPLTVVESMWDGRNEAIRVVDKASIVCAVIECVTFLLLRQSKDSYPQFSTQSWTKCGKLLIEILSFYLTGLPNVIGSAEDALDDLSATIARDLLKLDEASSNADVNGRGINQTQWLWEETGLQNIFALAKNQPQPLRRFKCLLDHLSTARQSGKSHLLPSCRNLFRSVISNINGYADKTCNKDDGELLLATIRCCGVDNLFPIMNMGESCTSTNSVEDFILNDLLRWILVHGSTSQRSSVCVDFKILKLCLYSIASVSRQSELWETVLRELVKAYCDYTTIADGLLVMISYERDSCPNCIVKCKVLDTFAAGTAQEFASSFRRSHGILRDHSEDVDDDEESRVLRKGDLSLFLRTCAGIASHSFGLLVSVSVVKEWIASCCESTFNAGGNIALIHEDDLGANVLLQALLVLKSTQTSNFISDDEVVTLLLESWREGGRIWSETSAVMLKTSPLKDDFIVRASLSLCGEIKSQPTTDRAVLELVSEAWAIRAKKLLEISQSKSLDSVGLHDLLLWDSGNQSEFLFLCLMYLLYLVEANDRQELLFKNRDEKLFVHILRCISKTNGALSTSFEIRTVRNQQLVDIVGDVAKTILERCCVYGIDLLSSLASKEAFEDDDHLNRTLTALTFLMSLLFRPVRGKNEIGDDLSPTSIKEGDSIWYEKAEGEARVKAIVVKVHLDDFPDLYYTIKVDESNTEKQTVAKKLKRYPSPQINERLESLEANDDSAISDRLGRCIVTKLLQPNDIGTNEMAAECINIITSQCGFAALGVGSVKYDVFKMVSSIESLLCDTLTAPANELSFVKCIPLLRSLSLSMGYGIYTIPSWKNVAALKLDPSGSIIKILDLYGNPGWIADQLTCPMQPFHASVTMWLTVALYTIKDEETYRRLLATFRLLGEFLLKNDDSVSNSIHILNAAASVQAASIDFTNPALVESEDEKQVLLQLTRCFVDSHRSVSSAWAEKFSSLLRTKGKKFRSMFMEAAKSCSNELVDCLFSPQKRWCAFQILDAFASGADEDSLETDDSIVQQQFAAWKISMDDEEAVELEEDLRTTASWLPAKLMSLLKSIGECASSIEHEDKDPLLGNLLAWITCLNIMDTAGSADMRNRSAVGAFIKKTNALGVIMEIALSETDLGTGDKEDIFACTELDASADFVTDEVALLVLFRTVEALPTLVKTWFNDDCPKYWQQKFSTFVEKRVAPATLQRELDRIKQATCFDEMAVNGSCASREVVATYHQDEVRSGLCNLFSVYV
eukprot:scaffold5067_cov161-Skeletonema_menzelii.AAC.11